MPLRHTVALFAAQHAVSGTEHIVQAAPKTVPFQVALEAGRIPLDDPARRHAFHEEQAPVKFRDLHVFKEKRFSVGVEETSGRFYLSFPVANLLVDYQEYYEIEPGMAAAAPGNLAELERLVDLSRCRQNDHNLMIPPGTSRGTAV